MGTKKEKIEWLEHKERASIPSEVSLLVTALDEKLFGNLRELYLRLSNISQSIKDIKPHSPRLPEVKDSTTLNWTTAGSLLGIILQPSLIDAQQQPNLDNNTNSVSEVTVAQTLNELNPYMVVPLDKGTWYSKDGNLGFFMPAGINKEFQNKGGVDVYGNIMAQPFKDDAGRINVVTEKVIWQIDEQGNITFANVMDTLSKKKGMDDWLLKVYQIPPNQSFPQEKGMTYDQIVVDRTQVLESFPEIQSYIAADPNTFDFFGLPVSIKDFGSFMEFRFERGALRLLKEDTSDNLAGTIIPIYGGVVALKSDSIVPLQALKPISEAEVAKLAITPPDRPHLIEKFGGEKDHPFIAVDYDTLTPAVRVIPGKDYQKGMEFYAQKVAAKQAVPTNLHVFELDSYLADPHFANDKGDWFPFYDQTTYKSYDFIKIRRVDTLDDKGAKIAQDIYLVFNPINALLPLDPNIANDKRKRLNWYLLAGIDGIGGPYMDPQTGEVTANDDFFSLVGTT